MQNLTATQIKLLNTLNNGSMTATEAKALGFDGFEIVDLDAFEFITIKGGVLTIAQAGIDAIEILNTVKNGSITSAEAKALGLNPFVIIDLDSAGFITLTRGVITIAQAGIDANTSTEAKEVQNLTELETKVLKAIDDNDFLFSDNIAEESGLNKNQIGGVVASLTKKDLIEASYDHFTVYCKESKQHVDVEKLRYDLSSLGLDALYNQA